jgi:hypothetical protein
MDSILVFPQVRKGFGAGIIGLEMNGRKSAKPARTARIWTKAASGVGVLVL